MKFCPKCGAQNDDSYSFCYMCGEPFNSERKAEEPVHEEPVHEEPKAEPQYVPQQPAPQPRPAYRSKISSKMLYGAIALVVVAIIAVALLVPVLMVEDSDNEVTVTIESVSIKDQAGQYVTDAQGYVTYYVTVECSNGSESKTMTFKSTSDSYKCKTDGTAVEPKVSQFITMNGNSSGYTYTVFLLVDTGKASDTVDIYTEKNISGTKPTYIGYSGVKFSASEIKDGKITLTGDSDPIGSITLSFDIKKK